MHLPVQKLFDNLQVESPLSDIVSIWGDMGIGKTTLALQMAIYNVKKNKKVLFIYSKPQLPVERIQAFSKDLSPDFRDKICFIKITNFKKLYSYLLYFEFEILNMKSTQKQEIDLIIIDSLTDLYRIELNRFKKQKNYVMNYQLNHILGILKYLKITYSIDSIIVNEAVTLRDNEEMQDVESGGKVMDFWINKSIHLGRTEILSVRKFKLFEERDGEPTEFNYILTENGFELYEKKLVN